MIFHKKNREETTLVAKPGGGGGRLAAGLAAGSCAEGAGATPERAKLEGQVAL